MQAARSAPFLTAFFLDAISIPKVKLRQAYSTLDTRNLYAIFMGFIVGLELASLPRDSRRLEWCITLAQLPWLAETFAIGITVETSGWNWVILSSNRGGHKEVIQPWVGDIHGINNSGCAWVILQLDHCDVIVGMTAFDFFHRDSYIDPTFG
jgi:hypothetical protein